MGCAHGNRDRRVGGWKSGFAAAALSTIFLLGVMPAMALDPVAGLRIAELSASGRTAAAVAAIDAALAGESDHRTITDLLRRKAELLAETGDHAGAAAAAEALATAIGETEGELSPNLVPVLDLAATEHDAAGNPASALSVLERLLAILVNAGLPHKAEPYLARLALLGEQAGDPALKDRATAIARAHAEAARAFVESDRSFDIDPEKGYSIVKIYYATDRARTGSEYPNEFYGGQRGELEYGTAEITIPEGHRPGEIEKPSIWTFDFREDPEKHIVLSSITPAADTAVFSEMQAHLKQTESDEAFVFVHGFNVPFHEAAKRTAQMAFDMNFDGLPILFSWPSRASVLSYIADTAVVNLSGRRLSAFLDDVVAKSGAKRIHLIAHSMGNRAMTDALELFALRHADKKGPSFDQVLFTAPDLDAGLFAEMMKTIRPTARRITLYASNADWALAVSRQLHGDAPRAGQGGEGILHMAEIDSVDMTTIGEDMLAHSYYANNPSALSDMLALFWRDAPPESRCGMAEAKGANGSYWQYSAEQCDTGALLSTLAYLRRGGIATVSEARQFMNRFIVPTSIDPEDRSRLLKALDKLLGSR